VAPLLDQRSVVDHQHGLRPAHEPFGLFGQHALQPRVRPGRGGHEVMQVLDVARRDTGRHRLHALALARQEQAAQVERRPAALFGAGQGGQERGQPRVQLCQPSL
jgi:hypothetical protein